MINTLFAEMLRLVPDLDSTICIAAWFCLAHSKDIKLPSAYTGNTNALYLSACIANQCGVLRSRDASDHRMSTSPHATTPRDEYPLSVPQLTVQHDFLDVVDDVRAGNVKSDEFWASVYLNEKPSVHGKVRVSRSDTNEDKASSICFEGRDGVLWHGSSIVRELSTRRSHLTHQ